MAPLRYSAKFDPPSALHPCTIQGKGRGDQILPSGNLDRVALSRAAEFLLSAQCPRSTALHSVGPFRKLNAQLVS